MTNRSLGITPLVSHASRFPEGSTTQMALRVDGPSWAIVTQHCLQASIKYGFNIAASSVVRHILEELAAGLAGKQGDAAHAYALAFIDAAAMKRYGRRGMRSQAAQPKPGETETTLLSFLGLTEAELAKAPILQRALRPAERRLSPEASMRLPDRDELARELRSLDPGAEALGHCPPAPLPPEAPWRPHRQTTEASGLDASRASAEPEAAEAEYDASDLVPTAYE